RGLPRHGTSESKGGHSESSRARGDESGNGGLREGEGSEKSQGARRRNRIRRMDLWRAPPGCGLRALYRRRSRSRWDHEGGRGKNCENRKGSGSRPARQTGKGTATGASRECSELAPSG